MRDHETDLCLFSADEFLAEMLGDQSIAAKARRRRREGPEEPTLLVSRLGDEDGSVNGEASGSGVRKHNVDDLLPVGVSVLPIRMLFPSRGKGDSNDS